MSYNNHNNNQKYIIADHEGFYNKTSYCSVSSRQYSTASSKSQPNPSSLINSEITPNLEPTTCLLWPTLQGKNAIMMPLEAGYYLKSCLI